MRDEQTIEQEIKAQGLTAPRVTPADIDAAIMSEHYFTAQQGALGNGGNGTYKVDWEVPKSIEALGCLTFCVLVLRNGFTVSGERACASPENFNEEIGRKIARENARQKIWPLQGYLLKSMLTAAA